MAHDARMVHMDRAAEDRAQAPVVAAGLAS